MTEPKKNKSGPDWIYIIHVKKVNLFNESIIGETNLILIYRVIGG